jgi:hypothetical protein
VLAAEAQQLVRRARGVCADDDLYRLDQLGRDLREGVLDDLDVIGGGIMNAPGVGPLTRCSTVGVIGGCTAMLDGLREFFSEPV